jgi:O-antigen/teichoic acid export membrane protein
VLALVGLGMMSRFAGTVVAAAAGFATTALAVRLFGTSRYGTLALGLAIVGLVGVAGRLGLGVATMRRIAAMRSAGDQTGIEETAQAVTTLMISLALLGSALVAALIYFTQREQGAVAALLLGAGLGLLLLGVSTAAAGQAIAQGMGRMVLMEVPRLALVLLQLLAVVVLTVLGVTDIVPLALGFGAAGLLSCVITRGLIRGTLSGATRLFRPAARQAIELIVLASPYAVAAVTTQIISRFDVLVLGLTHTSAVVGGYESTLRVVDAFLLLIPGVLMAPYVPAATVVFTRGDSTGFRDLYIFVSKLAYVGSLPVILALVAFPEVTLRGFFGAHYPAAGGIIWILLAGYVINLVFGMNSQALIAAGQRKRLAKVYGLALGSMVGLAFALIPVLGATGAALSTASSYIVLNVGVGLALFRSTGVSPFRTDMVTLLLTSLLPAASILLIRGVVAHPGVPLVLLTSLGLWALWLGVVVGTRAIKIGELLELIPRRRTGLKG